MISSRYNWMSYSKLWTNSLRACIIFWIEVSSWLVFYSAKLAWIYFNKTGIIAACLSRKSGLMFSAKKPHASPADSLTTLSWSLNIWIKKVVIGPMLSLIGSRRASESERYPRILMAAAFCWLVPEVPY